MKLTYQQQNYIQDIAIRHGTLLTYCQQVEFAKIRADKRFSHVSDAKILYVIMTPCQRLRFERDRFE